MNHHLNGKVICPYCNRPAELIDSIKVYGISYGMIWACLPCHAWVGVHKTLAPLGTLANDKLRRWRRNAHAEFDPLWKKCKNPKRARSKAYKWLQKKLELTEDACHIAKFDEKLCKEVIKLSKELSKKLKNR